MSVVIQSKLVKVDCSKSMLNPLQPNISVNILQTVVHKISYGVDRENLFNNQELLQLVIISFILMTLMPDSVVTLWEEITC